MGVEALCFELLIPLLYYHVRRSVEADDMRWWAILWPCERKTLLGADGQVIWGMGVWRSGLRQITPAFWWRRKYAEKIGKC